MEDNKNKQNYGLESHFTEDVYFYKNVKISGKLDYDFGTNDNLVVNNLEVLGIASFRGPAYFYDNIYVAGNIDAGIITARVRLDVGIGGTILTTTSGNIGVGSTLPRQRLDINGNTNTSGNAIVGGNIGVGTTQPQQKIDIAGNIKIDGAIYDSANTPGRNGYSIVTDEKGIRWIPLIVESIPGDNAIGVPTDGIFVLDEGTPLYPS